MAKKPILIKRLIGLIRRNPIKSAAAVLSLLAAYPGGMAGARLLSDQLEPSWYASHDWVRWHVGEKIKPIVTAQSGDRQILRDFQIDQASRSVRDETNNLAKWSVEKGKTNDPVTLDLIDRQIKLSKDSIDALNKQLDTVKDLKAKGQ